MKNEATTETGNTKKGEGMMVTAKDLKRMGFERRYSSDGLRGKGMYWFAPARVGNFNSHVRVGKVNGNAQDAFKAAVRAGYVIVATVVKVGE